MGDEWLAAGVHNPIFIRHVVLGETEEEYEELVELMSAVGRLWVQDRKCDWAAYEEALYKGAVEAPMRLR